jgi:hypothetical protein
MMIEKNTWLVLICVTILIGVLLLFGTPHSPGRRLGSEIFLYAASARSVACCIPHGRDHASHPALVGGWPAP